MHDDQRQQRQRRTQLLENPLRQTLAGGIFQTRNVVQVIVVQLVEQRLKRALDVGKIHHPALRLDEFATEVEFDPKRMAMQPCALVTCRQIRQTMRRLDGKDFEDIQTSGPGK